METNVILSRSLLYFVSDIPYYLNVEDLLFLIIISPKGVPVTNAFNHLLMVEVRSLFLHIFWMAWYVSAVDFNSSRTHFGTRVDGLNLNSN